MEAMASSTVMMGRQAGIVLLPPLSSKMQGNRSGSQLQKVRIGCREETGYHPRMVQKTVTVYTDDLTGAESDEVRTHAFSLDGVSYEIDLVSDNYDKLFEALAPSSRRAVRPVG